MSGTTSMTSSASGLPQPSAPAATLPPLRADMVLIHAPAVFEFRDRRDIYFPFLGTSGDVPITPLYEYFPLGFKTLQRYLSERGHTVKLINLSTLLLRYPRLSLDAVVEALDVRFVGIDLHWMVHVQGALAVAERIKQLRSELPIIFGGISSTYYAHELIGLPQVDMVMRGYDTHQPLDILLSTADSHSTDLSTVPNLLWRSQDGSVHANPMSHLPSDFSCGIDWSTQPSIGHGGRLAIREVLSTQNAGCAYNCPWCGGSRDAFRRIFGKKPSMARKATQEVAYEFDTMNRLPDVENYHFYSVGFYNETRQGAQNFLDRVAESNFKSISYEQFFLTPEPVLRRMVEVNKRTSITLSPESHDLTIAKRAGRGVYTNAELERWLTRALEIGIRGVDIWYFVGMPGQDADSVAETVDYCERLLAQFPGTRVNPMICPMIPFLDPASEIFEHPEAHDYRLFFRTVDEHARGMENASMINRINYETRWLSRADLVNVSFRAVRRLMAAKAGSGNVPPSWSQQFNAKITDALEFIDAVHEADCLADVGHRRKALDALGEDILRRNNDVLFNGVSNQAFPLNREIGGRWFDEFGWPQETLDAAVRRDAA